MLPHIAIGLPALADPALIVSLGALKLLMFWDTSKSLHAVAATAYHRSEDASLLVFAEVPQLLSTRAPFMLTFELHVVYAGIVFLRA